MVSINGNGNVNNNPWIGKDVASKEVKGKQINEIVVPDNKALGEFGDKLLEQVQPRFVQTAKIPEADAVQLAEMYKMAGITRVKMPTVAQYASVANHVGNFAQDFDKLTTTNNAERLFNSPEFEALNKAFGIS